MEYGEKTFHLEMAVPSEHGKIEKKNKVQRARESVHRNGLGLRIPPCISWVSRIC